MAGRNRKSDDLTGANDNRVDPANEPTNVNDNGVAGVDGQPSGDSLRTDGAIDPTTEVKNPKGAGRHKSGCECDRCVARNAAKSDESSGSGGGGVKKPANQSGKNLAVNTLADQLFGGHKILAMITKQPLLEISETEAKTLAAAIKNVAQYHSIKIDPKYAAYGQLLVGCAAVYGPKIYLISKLPRAPKKEKTPPAATTETQTVNFPANTHQGTMVYQ